MYADLVGTAPVFSTWQDTATKIAIVRPPTRQDSTYAGSLRILELQRVCQPSRASLPMST